VISRCQKRDSPGFVSHRGGLCGAASLDRKIRRRRKVEKLTSTSCVEVVWRRRATRLAAVEDAWQKSV